MTTFEIEEIILGMADLVHENRALRKENNELRLATAKHEAFVDSLVSKKGKERYDVLCEIEAQNRTVDLCSAMGWGTNLDYIPDWPAEVEKRLEQRSC